MTQRIPLAFTVLIFGVIARLLRPDIDRAVKRLVKGSFVAVDLLQSNNPVGRSLKRYQRGDSRPDPG